MFTDRGAKSDAQNRADRDDPLRFEGTITRRLAAAFVLYGLVATAFLAINIPPYQNPDEPAHFMRAAQVAQGGLVGTRFSGTESNGTPAVWGGGLIDPALLWAFAPFDAVRYSTESRARRAMWAPRIHWTRMRVLQVFSNTAVDPPLFYVPAAFGVLVGRVTRMTVVQTLVVSRLLTGVASVAVAATAIACAGGAAVWLFAILTLPMSLSQFASPSQDALMLSCSALAGALLVRLFRWPGPRDGKVLAWLAAMLILVATSRPPYGALAVLPLGLTRVRMRSRVVAAAAIVVGVLVWSAIAAATAVTNTGAFVGADPPAQIAQILGNPLLPFRVLWTTLRLYWPGYLEEFVGRLSWLDLELPPAYHTAAHAMLAVAAVAAMLGLRGERISLGSRLVIATGLLLAAAGVFAIEYVTWTAPGHATVEGVEGRYFLPLALAGAALLPALGKDPRLARLHDPLVLLVAAFPVVTLAVVMHAVVLRYYLG